MLTKESVRKKKAIIRTVLVPLDEEQAAVLQAANDAHGRARLLGTNEDDAKKALEAAHEALEAAGALKFVFRGIGRDAFEALRLEHQPTDEQRAKPNGEKAQWNVDTFPAALCAAACSNSDMSESEWRKEIFGSSEWGAGELAMLLDAALAANSDQRVVQLGN